MISDPYDAADAPLRDEEVRLLARLGTVRKLRADIAAARAEAGTPVAALPHNYPASTPTVASTPITTGEKFRGMGLGEACAKQLAENRGIELTAKQVWAALSGAGFSIISERPEAAVNWALRKREKKEGDVVLVGDGKWGRAEWYSPNQLRKFRDQRNNASGRNHIEHVERTRAGIANAMNGRLEHWGRRRTLTGERMAKAYEAIQRGESKFAAAKAAGIAHPTFAWYWKAFEMENWKPGLPFPPARRAVELEKVPKKNEMWPRDDEYLGLELNENGPRH